MFSDLVGQEAIVKTLTNAINLNKIAHAYLFTGPRGTGKTSSARIFAMSLNCQNGPTAQPCGKCPSCLDIKNGSSLDVIEIDAASNNKVEDARNILEKVQFVAVSGKFKIYIIDEVHMLTSQAFNTLLKTLEEPPPNLIFILATTESHKVLDTIVSRCQRFDFRRITLNDIISRLKYVANEEKINISDEAIALIASASSGGMRDALALLDQASVLGTPDTVIEAKDILSLIGKISNDNMFDIVDIIAQKQTQKLAVTLQNLVQAGNEPLIIVREMINYFRNLLIAKTCDNSENISALINTTQGFLEKLAAQSKLFEVIELVQIIEKLSEYEKNLKNVSNQYLWLELSLIGLCYRTDIKVLSDLEQRVSELENIIKSGNINIQTQQVQRVAPSAPVSVPVRPAETPIKKEIAHPIHQEEPVKETIVQSATAQTVEEKESSANEQSKSEYIAPTSSNDTAQNWINLLSLLKRESTSSHAFFQGLSKPVEVTADRIVLTFAIDNFVKKAQEESKIKPLEDAAQKIFGKLPKILIRTPMAEDKEIKTKGIKPQVASKSASAPETEMEEIEQIVPKVIEQEVKEAKESMKQNAYNSGMDLPEQVKHIADIFQGKIME